MVSKHGLLMVAALTITIPLQPPLTSRSFSQTIADSAEASFEQIGRDVNLESESASIHWEDLALEPVTAASPSPLGLSTWCSEDKDAFRMVPYGSLWTNALYASQRTTPGPFTLWVLSRDMQGESVFEMDARRSRVGVNVNGPGISTGSSSFETDGRIEIDFFGDFLTENTTGTRLRHAYWEIRNDQWRCLIGQTWDLISPLRPRTLNFSVGWAGGNLGFRRTQLRLERTFHLANNQSLILQTSVNQDIVPDFQTNAAIRRESTGLPVLMERVAFAFPVPHGDQAAEIGFSGHFGETGFDFLEPGPPPLNLPPEDDARFKSWSVNIDAEIPLKRNLTFRGEFFHGANLSPYLGGIGQGVCPCLRTPIHSTGGWAELTKVWSTYTETRIGLGFDDPANGDMVAGRGLNQFAFANQLLHITGAISTGVEFSWWHTSYYESRVGIIPDSQLLPRTDGEAYVTEWMIRYDF